MTRAILFFLFSAAAHAAAPDKGDGGTVVRPKFGRRGGLGQVAFDEPGGQARGGGRQRTAFQEGTARNEKNFRSHGSI